MTSSLSAIGGSVARFICGLVTLCLSVGAQAQTLQIAASNSSNSTPNSYFNPSDTLISTAQNNNVIYGVTATPQTALPPALTLKVLPINPVYPQIAAYSGFYSLAYAPSAQP